MERQASSSLCRRRMEMPPLSSCYKPSPDSQALKNHHRMFFRAHTVRPRSSFLKAGRAHLLTRVCLTSLAPPNPLHSRSKTSRFVLFFCPQDSVPPQTDSVPALKAPPSHPGACWDTEEEEGLTPRDYQFPTCDFAETCQPTVKQ